MSEISDSEAEKIEQAEKLEEIKLIEEAKQAVEAKEIKETKGSVIKPSSDTNSRWDKVKGVNGKIVRFKIDDKEKK